RWDLRWGKRMAVSDAARLFCVVFRRVEVAVARFAEEGLQAFGGVLLDIEKRHFEGQRPEHDERLIRRTFQHTGEEILENVLVGLLGLFHFNAPAAHLILKDVFLMTFHKIADVGRSGLLQVATDLPPHCLSELFQFWPAVLTLLRHASSCSSYSA